jgi:hypothetical protein
MTVKRTGRRRAGLLIGVSAAATGNIIFVIFAPRNIATSPASFGVSIACWLIVIFQARSLRPARQSTHDSRAAMDPAATAATSDAEPNLVMQPAMQAPEPGATTDTEPNLVMQPAMQAPEPGATTDTEPSLLMQAAMSMARRGHSPAWIASHFGLPLALAEMLVNDAAR